MPLPMGGHLPDAVLDFTTGFLLGLAITFLFCAVQLKNRAG